MGVFTTYLSSLELQPTAKTASAAVTTKLRILARISSSYRNLPRTALPVAADFYHESAIGAV